jgi:hypothetical protein
MKILENQLMTARSHSILADRPEDRSLPLVIVRQPLSGSSFQNQQSSINNLQSLPLALLASSCPGVAREDGWRFNFFLFNTSPRWGQIGRPRRVSPTFFPIKISNHQSTIVNLSPLLDVQKSLIVARIARV